MGGYVCAARRVLGVVWMVMDKGRAVMALRFGGGEQVCL